MSHESPHAKLIYMANQIVNDFWEPRMRRHLFEVIDAGGEGLRPLVLQAAEKIKRPVSA